jgi:hypothetical protein
MKIALRLGVVLASAIVAVLMLEAYLRIDAARGPAPKPPVFKYTNTEGAISYEPGARFTLTNEMRLPVETVIDERGFRNPRAEPLLPGTVIMLGDSFTAGLNTPEPLTVAGRLREAGRRVVNAGVDGTGTTTHADILEKRFKDAVEPVVVLMFFLGNDFKDNYWTNPLPVTRSRTFVMRNEWADRFGKCGWLFVCRKAQESLTVSGYSLDPMGSFPVSSLMLIGPDTPQLQRALEVTREAVARIVTRVREQRGRLVMVGIPSKAEVLRSIREINGFSLDPNAELAARQLLATPFSWASWDRPNQLASHIAADLGVTYVSLLEPFRRQSAIESLYHPLYDGHWNEAGQRVAFEQLSAVLATPVH